MEQYITYTARKKPASSASAVHAQAPATAHLQAPALVPAQSQATAHGTARITNRKTAIAVAETNKQPYISSNYIINYAKDRMQSAHDCILLFARGCGSSNWSNCGKMYPINKGTERIRWHEAVTHEILAYELSVSLKVNFVIETVNKSMEVHGCTLDMVQYKQK